MGKQWDGGDVAFQPETWALVLRVLKPGGHLLAFSGTRTYHRMACAIEDAGFEIRDQIGWCYGSGFPKSHNVGNGWGSALKPAWEPIVLARKPLSESSIAANVLKHGTGGINVDGCRTQASDAIGRTRHGGGIVGNGTSYELPDSKHPLTDGRWPANLIHDGSEEVLAGFPETASSKAGWRNNSDKGDSCYHGTFRQGPLYSGHEDSGSAARFFYTAKADADDRLGSKHPTVKPIDLIQYLVRLVTPRGGVVLDPFAGTGTCGEAAFREGMAAILIEREPEYQADIVKRMGLCLAGQDTRRMVGMQQENIEGLPLFAIRKA